LHFIRIFIAHLIINAKVYDVVVRPFVQYGAVRFAILIDSTPFCYCLIVSKQYGLIRNRSNIRTIHSVKRGF